ncbi:hypothetical protein [Mesorhizobium abyssinicae]|uniref:hypothetical protein n=1 Tax=Mesorhizobium abyssinicae TaxID=1209958 RepID=UPI0033986F66
MKTLKQEEVQGLVYKDADEAAGASALSLRPFTTRGGLHSGLDYLTPEEYEQLHSGRRRMEMAA